MRTNVCFLYCSTMLQDELRQKFVNVDASAVGEDSDFNVKNANHLSIALVTLAKKMKIEGRRFKQLAKQYQAEVAVIAAREDKVARLEYARAFW